MKPFNWNRMQELVCKTNSCWGINIAGHQFDFGGEAGLSSPMWDFFIFQVHDLFPQAEALDILSSVINEDLLTFDSERDAWKLYRIMESPELKGNVYAIIYGPEGAITENT